VEDIVPRHTRQLARTVRGNDCVNTLLTCPHGTRSTMTCGALKQTSEEAVTTAAKAAVLLLAATGLSVYCHQHRPIHTQPLNFRCHRLDSMDVLHYHNVD